MSRDVLIIGAGVAGSAAAQTLQQAGLRCTAYDKGRRPGGRASTRQRDELAFDHGAQHLTAKSESFKQALDDWLQAGVVARWEARFAEVKAGALQSDDAGPRYVGLPAMSRVVDHLQEGIDVRYGQPATAVSRNANGWVARLEDGSNSEPHAYLIVALPAPQAATLLEEVQPDFAKRAAAARMTPNWTLMLGFEEKFEMPFDAIRWQDDPAAGWLAHNSSKPGRPRDGPDCWVFQAAESWTRDNLELDRDAAVMPMVELLRASLDAFAFSLPEPIHARAHRWRYAFTGQPVGENDLHDAGSSLTVVGDWLLGDRVESAYLSGAAGAQQIIKSLP